MDPQELLVGEVDFVADFLEHLARRRAGGEVTTLYPEMRDTADTITSLRHEAPPFLQLELAVLESRCNVLLRSIAH